MGNRQKQPRPVERLHTGYQVVGHAQCLRHRHAGVASGEDKFHLAQEQFLKGLGQIGCTGEGQVLFGIGAECRD
ncbi:hypothetical protein D3C86_1670360 [compost metagenome]